MTTKSTRRLAIAASVGALIIAAVIITNQHSILSAETDTAQTATTSADVAATNEAAEDEAALEPASGVVGDAEAAEAKPAAPAKEEKAATKEDAANAAPVAVLITYGKESAPIVIEEFASLSCSHCAAFAKSVLPELKKKYIDSGNVRLITHSYIRNEPDLRGSMLLHCLNSNDERQQFSKVLFEMQEQWAYAENVKGALGDIAKVGGIAQDTFDTCVSDTKLETGLLKDLQKLSETHDIQGTPTFYINGVKHSGSFDVGTLSKAIDEAKPAASTK